MSKKRIIAFLVAAVMILSTIPVISVTVAAAGVEGDWDTFRSADDYEELDDEGNPALYKAAPGYEYTDEGLSIIPADYSNTSPFFSVQTKDKQSLKDGVYLEFRVDDYAYSGESGAADNWICLTLWTTPAPVPGNTAYGEGWLCLLRDNDGVGAPVTIESFNTILKTETNPGAFNHLGNSIKECEMDEGREVYTFEVAPNGDQYDVKVNGVPVAGLPTLSAHLNSIDPNGEFYVGITMMSTVKDGTAALTITKYGTSAADAKPPVGSDSKEPEENVHLPYPDCADPSTVPENMPALMWDASTNPKQGAGQANVTCLGDNAFRIQATATACFMSFGPKRTVSYAAQDFPVVGILLRDCYASNTGIYYCSDDVLSANADYFCGWDLFDGEMFGEDDEYTFVTIDLSGNDELYGKWKDGRINSIRFDFNGLGAFSEEELTFDICYVGCFRSVEEAEAYNLTRLVALGVGAGDENGDGEETTVDSTVDTTEGDTAEGGNDETKVEDDSKTEDSAVDTGAKETDASDETTGCTSMIGMSAVAVLVAAAAAVALKKKD